MRYDTAYRLDIEMMRGVAVVLVLLFHAGVFPFQGGFVGVDVFFVISGYLVTNIIVRDIDRGSFSLSAFYYRRVRRILPALIVVLLFCLLVGYFVLFPRDYRDLGRAAFSSATFVSNLFFWWQGGYFDAASKSNALLHTWSLAVEEQYYITVPLLLLLFRKVSPVPIIYLVLVLLVISFVSSVASLWSDPEGSYFLLHNRAWELLAGAAAARVPVRFSSNRFTQPIALVGFALILCSGIIYSDETPFPGFAALLPVGGSVCVLVAGIEQKRGIGTVLLSKPVLFFGKISYSLYLWHWPILVFAQSFLLRHLFAGEQALYLCACTFAGWLSWKFVEQPFRHVEWSSKKLFSTAFAGSVIVVSCGAVLHLAQGFPSRFPITIDVPGNEQAYHRDKCFFVTRGSEKSWSAEHCQFGETSPLSRGKVFLWGDSYAAHYIPALDKLGHVGHFTVIQATMAACSPLFGDSNQQTRCAAFNERVTKYLESNHQDVLLISSRWHRIKAGRNLEAALAKTFDQVKSTAERVILIGESPEFAAVVPVVYQRLRLAGRDADWFTPVNTFRNDNILKTFAAARGIDVVRPRDALCAEMLCRIAEDGHVLFWDQGHLTYEGSSKVMALIGGMLTRTVTQK